MILSYDFETSGLLDYKALHDPSRQPHVAQIAAVLYSNDAKIVSQIDFLIKPEGWTIPQAATDIHGITTEMCEKYGISIKNGLAIFNQLVKKQPLIIGHNIEGYDNHLLKIECQRIGQPYLLEGLQTFDTMKTTTALCKIPKLKGFGFKFPKLTELHTHLFGVGFDGAHNALADVQASGRCFFEIKAKNLVNNEVQTT